MPTDPLLKMNTFSATLRIIYILWLRQVKHYWRSPARVIGSLGQPLLFLIALGYGLGAVFQQAGQGNFIEFLAPGIMGMAILFTSIFSGIEIIWDKQFGFLKETLVAPVSRLTIMFGRTLGGATVATIQGIIVFFLALAIGFRPIHVWMFFPALLFMLLIALLFTALGTAIASRLNDMQGFQLIMNFVVMPIFFLSGAIFPLNKVPTALAVVVKLNPLSYGIDAIRGLLVGGGAFSLTTDALVLAAITAVLVALGAWLFSGIQA